MCVDSARPEEAAACYRRCLELTSEASAGSTSALRRDRWSAALAKCNASLCDWRDWDAEVRALRIAVRRAKTRFEEEQGNIDSDEQDHGESREGNAAEEDAPFVARGVDLSGDSKRTHGEGINARPAIHPFDSLSAALSIVDSLVVAQQHSRVVLAQARRGLSRVEAARANRRETDENPSRPHRDGVPLVEGERLRLGYVSGDLMGTHPLTHLMQVSFGMEHSLITYD